MTLRMNIPRVDLLTPEVSAQVESHLQQLSEAAESLNDLSDQLTKEIAKIESTLNGFGLGVEASVVVAVSSSDDGRYSTTWRLRYGKQGRRWGFLIERVSEDASDQSQDEFESWLFGESPREHRIEAVTKIPELLDALLKKANYLKATIEGKVSYASGLAARISQAAPKGKK